MTLLDEFKIFVKSVFGWICIFAVSSIFLFVIGPKEVTVRGTPMYLPLPTENSISVLAFTKIKEDLLPPGVHIITTNPISAFVSQITVSLLLGLLITSPLLFYQFILYVHPALLPNEKRAVMWSLLPFVGLFFSGALFSYYFLIPATFRVLYPYATIMGIIPYFSVGEFIQYVFGLMIAVGLMFLLPLFMILLSFLGIIKPEFWKKKWRMAFVFFLVLSAIITPDGTGITMALLFIPLVMLYYAGYYFAKKYS